MGSLVRSEEMSLCQLFIQEEAAYLTVSELGEAGLAQFRDLNSDINPFQRRFVNEIRRCDEMERKLRFIETEILKDKKVIADDDENPRAPFPRQIIDLEAQIEKAEHDILELSDSAAQLQKKYVELQELKFLLSKAEVFFNDEENDSITRAFNNEDKSEREEYLDFIGGVVSRERMAAFEKMLWRISRGNVFIRQSNVEELFFDPYVEDPLPKTAFVAFFQGKQLKDRIKKICVGFRVTLYPCPTSHTLRLQMLNGLQTGVEDLKRVIDQTKDHRLRVMLSVVKKYPKWVTMVRKMKGIFHTLNQFNMDVSRMCLIGECWIPKLAIGEVKQLLVEVSEQISGIPRTKRQFDEATETTQTSSVSRIIVSSVLTEIATDEDPPTYNKTNKFTQGFQNLIDAYGVASYREANPALYALITFPFLFSVMFGDTGHGLIVFLFGLYMVCYEKKFMSQKSTNEIWNIFFGGRYIILLMGLFSMYTGVIYNDLFSKSVNLFGSHWSVANDSKFSELKESLLLDPKTTYQGEPYPIGIDPVWMLAENKIIFLNSYKMKLSIIFGVVHMIFGVCMSVINIVHFKKYSSLLLEFLPSLLFLLLLFAYLVTLMFVKWTLYSAKFEGDYGQDCAPSILITFINMLLQKSGKVGTCPEFMFTGQHVMQQCFVGAALLCIPVLLFGKPLYWLARHRKSKTVENPTENGTHPQLDVEMVPSYTEEVSDKSMINKSKGQEPNEEEGSFGEIMIHQAIHTIEYVLSTISHTASYLRLWALSLAHAQLSDVLWTMVLRKGLGRFSTDNILADSFKPIFLTLIFAAWAFFTVAILVLMEGLSAFLHTLRLHWVEFMSKFYDGRGHIFQPFCFDQYLESENSVEDE